MKRLVAILFCIFSWIIVFAGSGYVGDNIDFKVPASTDSRHPDIFTADWSLTSGQTNCITLTSYGINGAFVHIDSYFTGTVRVTCRYQLYQQGNLSAGTVNKTAFFDITCNAVTLTPNPSSLNMKVNDKEYITYSSSPSGKWPSVTYSSSNTSIASVDYSTGLVTAKAKGFATITLSNSMGPSATVSVSVDGGTDGGDSGDDPGGDNPGGGTTIKTGDWFQYETIEGYNMLFCAYTDAYTGELCCAVTSSKQGLSTIANANGKVTIPSYPKGVKVTKINNNAFHDVDGMTELVIPSTVAYIGPSICNSCPNLTKLTCEATTPPSAYSDSFGWQLRSGTLYVPKGCVSKYQSAKGWKEFKSIKEIGSADNVLVSSITLYETSITLNEGETKQLTATISPSNATNKDVTWNSSNTSVATVSSSGLVTAKASGSATLTCKAADSSGKNATCSVTVKSSTVEPTGITISPTSKTITVGDTFYASYTLIPSNATTTVTWASDNTSIATVSQSGLVKGISAGSTWIYITTANNITSYFKITVNPATIEPTNITISPSSKTVKVGETFTMTYTLSPSNATTTLTWTSDDSSIATVSSSGVVKGIKAGTTNINVKTANGKTDYCKVTVESSSVEPTRIEASPHTVTINLGKTFTLSYALSPSYSKTSNITISHDDYIEIENGNNNTYIVKGIKLGTSTIKLETANSKIDSCVVTIVNPTGNQLSNGDMFVENTIEGCGITYMVVSANDKTCQVGDDNNRALAATDRTTSITLPETVRGFRIVGIGNKAFYICSRIENITLPKGIMYIGNNAFQGCSKLASINLPSSITSIGEQAFYSCRELSSLVIPIGVQSIKRRAFRACRSLAHVSLPSTLVELEEHAFSDNNNLSVIYSNMQSPFSISSNTFSSTIYTDAQLFVPKGTVESYRCTEGWSEFQKIQEIKDVGYNTEISSLGYATFYSSESAYTLPNGLSAQVVTNASNGKLMYKTIADGAVSGVIPKGTAVMLSSDDKRSGTFTLIASDSQTTYNGANLLRGSDEATTTTGDGYHYKLSYGELGTNMSSVFGWYWGTQNGGSFQIEGHKAWLVVPKSAATRGFTIDGDATGIFNIEHEEKETEFFDLSGRRISLPSKKSMYIKNGKKVIIK